mmetsp:Transcript_1377/g.3309  ORF Transcript_1377/g.3309 Transcript_1377/m.3309 type:complete len:265 (+) Transcript_1377:62-856(+)
MSRDLADRASLFLQKREGIDKALKLIRYTARLVAATSPESELQRRCSAFEKSVGVSRKAFRLGKFLQDVNAIRHSRTTGYLAILELIAYGGEGVYYFIEQLAWLIKAGAISKESEEELSKISAWAELLGYMANICLSSIKIRNINRRLRSLQGKTEQTQKCLQRDSSSSSISTSITSTHASQPGFSKGASEGGAAQDVSAQLAMLRAAKATCVLAIVQDTADALIAINDIRGGKDVFLRHPATLAVAGLVSGCISFRKNWRACR